MWLDRRILYFELRDDSKFQSRQTTLQVMVFRLCYHFHWAKRCLRSNQCTQLPECKYLEFQFHKRCQTMRCPQFHKGMNVYNLYSVVLSQRNPTDEWITLFTKNVLSFHACLTIDDIWAIFALQFFFILALRRKNYYYLTISSSAIIWMFWWGIEPQLPDNPLVLLLLIQHKFAFY